MIVHDKNVSLFPRPDPTGSISRNPHLRNLGPVYEWGDHQTYLLVDRVSYREKKGALLVYNNPPVHQVATPGLHAFLDGIDEVTRHAVDLEFLILYDSNDLYMPGAI